jgi:N-acetyltransferase
MTLDLGQKTTRTCPDCGMSYTPTQREDAALHARFHTQSAAESRGAAPPRISPQTVKALLAGNGVCSISGGGGGASGAIVCVRPGDEAAKRRAAETCLRVAERELGAVEMRAEELWGQKELKSAGESGDAYRLFMCLRGQQCVGLLLAERIETARAAVSQAGGTALSDGEVVPATQELSPVEDCPVFASNEEYPAVLGIARIWTARSARRSGVAQGLLEQACRNFLPGAVVETDRVAFSQPTQMGARLARRFFGKKWGWLVYTG